MASQRIPAARGGIETATPSPSQAPTGPTARGVTTSAAARPAGLAAREPSAAAQRPRQGGPTASARLPIGHVPNYGTMTPVPAAVRTGRADPPTPSAALGQRIVDGMRNGDSASHRLLGDYLAHHDFNLRADNRYGGAERAILEGIASHGDVEHLNLLGAHGADLTPGSFDLLSAVLARNPDATRPDMLSRLLNHPDIGRRPGNLAEPLRQAARRGLVDETGQLLARGAKERKLAMEAALEAGHPDVAQMIRQHIDAQPRNPIGSLLRGLGG